MKLDYQKSNRTIIMPDFLAVEMADFISSLYGIRDDDRIFTISKSYLHHEMDRGAKLATWVLKDYVKKFQLRNPQLYVIGAYIHLDEETPHLHLNFIPWVSGCKRGLETKTTEVSESDIAGGKS